KAMLAIEAGWVLVAFAGAFAAGGAGYMTFAVLLGSGVLGSGYVALVLYAGVRVGDALVAFLLRVRPLRLLGMVERRRPLLERRAHGLLRWLAIGGWGVVGPPSLSLVGGAGGVGRAAPRGGRGPGLFTLSLGAGRPFSL